MLVASAGWTFLSCHRLYRLFHFAGFVCRVIHVRARCRSREYGLPEGQFMAEESGALPLTEDQLARVIDEKTFHRAQPYVREFTHRLLSGRSITGRVAGPHGVYTVSLTIEDSTLTPACSCSSDPGFCRHAIALGLTYIEEPQSFYDVRTLTTALEQYSHGELV